MNIVIILHDQLSILSILKNWSAKSVTPFWGIFGYKQTDKQTDRQTSNMDFLRPLHKKPLRGKYQLIDPPPFQKFGLRNKGGGSIIICKARIMKICQNDVIMTQFFFSAPKAHPKFSVYS